MLSKNNIDSLVLTGVYSVINRMDGVTWCRNWTFTVHKYGEKYYMVDTYWGGGGQAFSVELTDENFSNFKLEMDLDKVENVAQGIYDEYADDARFNLATDSGGWSYSKYYVLKNRKPSREKKIALLKDKIKQLESSIEWNRNDLARIDSNSSYE